MYLFDMDGTLIDSNDVWKDVDREFLARRGLPYTKAYYEGVAHTIFPLAAKFTKEFCNLPDSEEDIMAEWMELAKDELEKMQRRLDVILAVSEENWENRKKEWNQSVESTKAGFAQRRDELVSGIEKRFERAKELLPSGRLNVNREELFDLRSKFGVNLQRPELASFLKDFTKRDMLRGNPGMVSKKFSEALEELKKSAVEYKKREKK